MEGRKEERKVKERRIEGGKEGRKEGGNEGRKVKEERELKTEGWE